MATLKQLYDKEQQKLRDEIVAACSKFENNTGCSLISCVINITALTRNDKTLFTKLNNIDITTTMDIDIGERKWEK